jgi:tetratricopeptide (TPR) repeat protein
MSTTSIGADDIRARAMEDIRAALASGDLNRAIEIADLSIRRGVRDPQFYQIRGRCLHDAGRYEEAIADYRRAMPAPRQDPAILGAIGACLLKLERLRPALEAFDASLAINPKSPEVHYHRGLALATDGNHDEAARAYERAIALAPNYVEPIANLASIAARKGEARAEGLARRALRLNPQAPMAKIALVMLEIENQSFVKAEQALRSLLAEDTLSFSQCASARRLLADTLDGQGRYAEAFAIYDAVNHELRDRNADRFPRRGVESANHLIAYFEQASPARWVATDPPAASPDAPAEHVFLLGFVRSGTTLLEQVLGSHPNVVALEEKGLLNDLSDRFMTSNVALESLSSLSGRELANYREMYWRRVRELAGSVTGKVFVDKQPLNSVKLPLISKLFPAAKVLFALRDPRDVVFSCFRRPFKINLAMFEFLSLADAAEFYAAVMRLTELYRTKLPLNVLDHRYEDLVQDFEGQVRKICTFIGVEWAEEMRHFDKLAPAVDLRSPSARQVARPLYAEGAGHWRNYAEQLAPALPVLEPWVGKFGYSEN